MKKILLVLLIGTSFLIAKGKLNIIKIDEAQKLYNSKDALFVDARPFKLYQRGTIMGSVNIPVKQYKKLKKFLPANKKAKIVTFCNGYACKKSDKLAFKLQKDGYKNVLVYKGGYPEWNDKGKAVMALSKKGKKKQTSKAYKPPLKAITVNGVNIYLLPEDGEANEDGLIDQFWLYDQMKGGKKAPKGINLVDLRKAEKYKVSHIQGAINIPYDTKNEKLDLSKLPKDGIIVFYCNTGLISVDARTSIEDEKLAKRVFVYDISYSCDKKHKNCKIKPNEAL
ncbi:MAG: hypothetical protein B1H07_01425 [Campylobacteraceae bacterium 4484_166]|nr:MAG: hypothetical protein B1H07_01425 [Campylobacteraceae bacterium 4484_166]